VHRAKAAARGLVIYPETLKHDMAVPWRDDVAALVALDQFVRTPIGNEPEARSGSLTTARRPPKNRRAAAQRAELPIRRHSLNDRPSRNALFLFYRHSWSSGRQRTSERASCLKTHLRRHQAWSFETYWPLSRKRAVKRQPETAQPVEKRWLHCFSSAVSETKVVGRASERVLLQQADARVWSPPAGA
jgi:hypothetical protein